MLYLNVQICVLENNTKLFSKIFLLCSIYTLELCNVVCLESILLNKIKYNMSMSAIFWLCFARYCIDLNINVLPHKT